MKIKNGVSCGERNVLYFGGFKNYLKVTFFRHIIYMPVGKGEDSLTNAYEEIYQCSNKFLMFFTPAVCFAEEQGADESFLSDQERQEIWLQETAEKASQEAEAYSKNKD